MIKSPGMIDGAFVEVDGTSVEVDGTSVEVNVH
jgi:hypothetical protein